MKVKTEKFIIQSETSLVGFDTEQVYKVSMIDSNVKICNIFEDKQGKICVGSVCHTDIDVLIEALKFAKRKIK